MFARIAKFAKYDVKKKGRPFEVHDQKSFKKVSGLRRPNVSFVEAVKGWNGEGNGIEEQERLGSKGDIGALLGRVWGKIVVTDPCLEDNLDWSFGVVCVRTSKKERIGETVEICCGQSKYRIRVWEIEGKTFDLGLKENLAERESGIKGNEALENDKSEEEDDGLLLEEESSKNFYGHEDEELDWDRDEEIKLASSENQTVNVAWEPPLEKVNGDIDRNEESDTYIGECPGFEMFKKANQEGKNRISVFQV
ncbi:hypothetical protein L2E82_39088 [Cichorium intybus]|uniref:Uncharacterized protein n=1 Tax=Cichorium intybus TaxID=13427 RepID=A0ACB9AI07_CICIN|nr:hypothetical protein L2E82_39088 [Cichorium intybus]